MIKGKTILFVVQTTCPASHPFALDGGTACCQCDIRTMDCGMPFKPNEWFNYISKMDPRNCCLDGAWIECRNENGLLSLCENSENGKVGGTHILFGYLVLGTHILFGYLQKYSDLMTKKHKMCLGHFNVPKRLST